MLSQNLVMVVGLSWFLRCRNQRWIFRTSQSSCFDKPSNLFPSGDLVMDVNTFSKIALGWALWAPLSCMPRFMAHGLAINLSNNSRTAKIPSASGKAERTWLAHVHPCCLEMVVFLLAKHTSTFKLNTECLALMRATLWVHGSNTKAPMGANMQGEREKTSSLLPYADGSVPAVGSAPQPLRSLQPKLVAAGGQGHTIWSRDDPWCSRTQAEDSSREFRGGEDKKAC